jgi:hypothetical protein
MIHGDPVSDQDKAIEFYVGTLGSHNYPPCPTEETRVTPGWTRSTSSEATARSSLCQFCMDWYQNSEVVMNLRTPIAEPPWAACVSLYVPGQGRCRGASATFAALFTGEVAWLVQTALDGVIHDAQSRW